VDILQLPYQHMEQQFNIWERQLQWHLNMALERSLERCFELVDYMSHRNQPHSEIEGATNGYSRQHTLDYGTCMFRYYFLHSIYKYNNTVPLLKKFLSFFNKY
jgi:hypothetical protein